LFPELTWEVHTGTGPTVLETAGMTPGTAERFAADIDRVALMVEAELGGLEGSTVCIASPDLADAFDEYVAAGQRLHAGVFAEEQILVMSAVELRMIDDGIAFGVPQLALWKLGEELGIDEGYPDPLGATIAHWYLARDTGRLDRYRSELSVALFLDDPNPEERTTDDAAVWVGERKPDPSFFDPQFLGSQMGAFIDWAVDEEGVAILHETDQVTWANLENRWRVQIRDQYPRGSFGLWWGVAIVVIFILLAAALAWLRWREKRMLAIRRPTPPPDETLFGDTATDT
jgi:hypothetical protein